MGQTCAAAVAVVTTAATQIIKILVRLNPYYDLENGYRVTPFTAFCSVSLGFAMTNNFSPNPVFA